MSARRLTLSAGTLIVALLAVACTKRGDGRDTATTQAAAHTESGHATATRAPFGAMSDGRAVERFTLTNAHGIEVKLMTYGAIITSLRTRDRAGTLDDIVLGYDSLSQYVRSSPYFGAVVGRFANRIAKGRFSLDGKTYQLATNDGPNALHGGVRGFDKVLWTGEPFTRGDTAGVVMRYTSADGEEGYPGELRIAVTYALASDDQLRVDYEATGDRATPLNVSQHSYWNLHGGGRGTILDHLLTLHASAFTPVDSTLIPTGAITPVAGTPFDFRTATAIGARIDQADAQLTFGKGYDHNWVLDGAAGDALHPALLLADTTTGRTLEIETTEPGLQFYSGNFLDGTIRGKGGQQYAHRAAVVLETQHYPDSPNHANFPTTILRPGQTYRSRTVFHFGLMR